VSWPSAILSLSAIFCFYTPSWWLPDFAEVVIVVAESPSGCQHVVSAVVDLSNVPILDGKSFPLPGPVVRAAVLGAPKAFGDFGGPLCVGLREG